MSHEERLEILTSIYRKALGLGVVKTSKEFAEALEMNVSTISSALNGSPKHLTESLVKKARRREERTFPGGELPKQEKRPDVVIPAETNTGRIPAARIVETKKQSTNEKVFILK